MIRRILLSLSLALSGCPGSSTGSSTGVVAGTADGVLLQGFGFRWKTRPHRINELGVELSGSKGCLRIQGGSWADGQEGSDQAELSLFTAQIASEGIQVIHGSTPWSTLTGTKGQPAAATESVTLSLTSLGLGSAQQVAVLLRGFELDTSVTHEDGYTTRGFGVRIVDASVSGETLAFSAWMRLEAGAVPDRIQNLASYGSKARVHYAVVGLSAGAVSSKIVEYTLKYPAGVSPTQPHASESLQSVSIQGAPGYGLGIVGLAGFDFTLNPNVSVWPGRYLREVAVRLHGFEYEVASGEMKLKCDGYFSNSGPVTWELTNQFSADLILIQMPSGSASIASKSADQSGVETCIP